MENFDGNLLRTHAIPPGSFLFYRFMLELAIKLKSKELVYVFTTQRENSSKEIGIFRDFFY